MGQIIGRTRDGDDIIAYEISGGILRAKVMNYGANLLELHVQTGDGDRDVVLGHKNIEDYFDNDPNYGCTIARCANRIGGAAFSLDGARYTLEKNDNGVNTLHSGSGSLQRRIWQTADEATDHVTFSIKSPDGDLGFPGNLEVTVTYTIRDDAVIIDYSALSDKRTIFNPTNHSYFNLKGEGNGDILDTQVQINADSFTHSDAQSVPDGQLTDVTGTPMDFRTYHLLGERINSDYEALRQAGGYDHNYVLRHTDELRAVEYDHDGMKEYEAAGFRAADDSIEAKVYTDLPGIQLYTGNYISGHDLGKCGKMYPWRGGVAFETQFFPNAINVPSFEQPVIEAGKPFHTRTVYKFTA
jgi:aldose 1-epimerase